MREENITGEEMGVNGNGFEDDAVPAEYRGWKFYGIYCYLEEILPRLRGEAEAGRWQGVRPENFIIVKDRSYSEIALTYREEGLYEMTFAVGFGGTWFDPDVSGEWFTCRYYFNIVASDRQVKKYYLAEQKDCYGVFSSIFEMISYKCIFASSDDERSFEMYCKRDWAFQKYCLMLDVMIPIILNHRAPDPLITRSMLRHKSRFEALLNTEMELVEEPDSEYIFGKGYFVVDPDARVNTSADSKKIDSKSADSMTADS